MNIPPDWELYGDPFYWTQVLFNLVENALKQNTEPGLSVTVAAARTPEACVITVTDTGVGIPAESLPFLFNRFYRVETHQSSEIKGTGLGPFPRQTRRGGSRRRHHRLQHSPPGNRLHHHHSSETVPGRKGGIRFRCGTA